MWLGGKPDQELIQIKTSSLCVCMARSNLTQISSLIWFSLCWPTGGEEWAGWTVPFVGNASLVSNQRMWSYDTAKLIWASSCQKGRSWMHAFVASLCQHWCLSGLMMGWLMELKWQETNPNPFSPSQFSFHLAPWTSLLWVRQVSVLHVSVCFVSLSRLGLWATLQWFWMSSFMRSFYK